MFAIERTWTDAVMEGWAPGRGVDWAAGVQRFLERASAKGRLGVRVGVLLAITAPFWLWGRLRSARSLSVEDRSRLLDEMLRHRFFFVREMTLLLKLVGCMALFAVTDLREKSGYDPTPRQRSGARSLHVLAASGSAQPAPEKEVA